MKVYGFDFSRSRIYATQADGNVFHFFYVNDDDEQAEHAFSIQISKNFTPKLCDHEELEAIFMRLKIPYDMDLDGIDILIKIVGGYLRLDPYHYGYCLYYNDAEELVSTEEVFTFEECIEDEKNEEYGE